MLCQICKKNQATVHVQEIVGGEKRTMHFCSVCAEKKSLLEPFLNGVDLNAIMQEMISQTLGIQPDTDTGGKPSDPEKNELTCPFCGWTDAKFQKTGRLGCTRCYHVFNSKLERILPSFQRGLTHIGKTPDTFDKSAASQELQQELSIGKQIESLRKDLTGSIQREEYELAAQLRDRIAMLEKKLAGKESPE